VLRGLPPVIDQRARVLILGSFPSTASLAAQQYYAHPQNLFWRIVGEIIGQPLREMPYLDRITAVQNAGIAIWDIYASCTRAGSLDSAIRDAVLNDLTALQKSAMASQISNKAVEPKTLSSPLLMAIRRVCFNGRMAARRIKDVEAAGFDVIVLPSTSPANAAMRYEEKFARWREALGMTDISSSS
jgi:double-stranded uracil-DNA glycosylase